MTLLGTSLQLNPNDRSFFSKSMSNVMSNSWNLKTWEQMKDALEVFLEQKHFCAVWVCTKQRNDRDAWSFTLVRYAWNMISAICFAEPCSMSNLVAWCHEQILPKLDSGEPQWFSSYSQVCGLKDLTCGHTVVHFASTTCTGVPKFEKGGKLILSEWILWTIIYPLWSF